MFEEDLDVFFADWGVLATPQSGEPFLVIFDHAYIAPMLGHAVESTKPMAVAQTADVSTLVEGNTLVIGGATYTIATPMPDGTGISVLELRSA